jgi:hypothetical protein
MQNALGQVEGTVCLCGGRTLGQQGSPLLAFGSMPASAMISLAAAAYLDKNNNNGSAV